MWDEDYLDSITSLEATEIKREHNFIATGMGRIIFKSEEQLSQFTNLQVSHISSSFDSLSLHNPSIPSSGLPEVEEFFDSDESDGNRMDFLIAQMQSREPERRERNYRKTFKKLDTKVLDSIASFVR
jgi:hypothetical protein